MHSSNTAADNVRTESLSFDDLPLAPFLKETIKEVGFTNPTPIQAQTIPLALEGKDIIGLAQTGTGKTAAFVLPIIEKIVAKKAKGLQALILAPTRELAEQIHEVIETFAPRTGIKSVTIYGGVSHGRQLDQLRRKPQIIVACPGRLLDHIGGRTIDLSWVETLVLDEADRMFDMGFLPEIKRIIGLIPKERQTLLFSATMPREIEDLTRGIQRDPVTVKVKTEEASALVTHSMYQVAQKAKPEMLSHWLTENKDALTVVFTKMKHTAKRLAEQLAKRGHHVTSLHGNLSQGKRLQSLSGFKDGRYTIMIATDIAARGIDVKGITHVVNYDMPENVEAYIHRTGRAGRASATGDAVSFVTREDTSLVRSIERWLKNPLVRLESPALAGSDSGDSSMEESDSRGRRGGRRTEGRTRSPRGERRLPRAGRREREAMRGNDSTEPPAGEGVEAQSSETTTREARPERRGNREFRGGRRDDRGARGPRGPRTGDRRERRDDRGERSERRPRGEGRSEGRRESFGRRDDRFERQPRYAYGPESTERRERPSFNRNRDDRPRGSRFGGERSERPAFRRDRADRQPSHFEGEARRRGQPRDRFESMEGPDLSQVDALKVLEKRERAPRQGGRGPARGGRGGFGGRPQRGEGRGPRAPRGEGRRWER